MKQALALFLSMFFSSVGLAASVDVLFPGPAQSQSGIEKSYLKFGGNGTIEWFSNRPFDIGFDDYKTMWNPKHCTDGKDVFECINNTKHRAKNLELKELTEKDFGKIDGSCPSGQMCILTPSNFKEYRANSNVTLILEEGKYYFDKLSINTSSKVIVNGVVEIHLNKFNLASPVKINADGSPKNLIFYHHNQNYKSDMDADDITVPHDDRFSINSDADIKAYIYSSGLVQLSYGGVLFGSVTARQLEMSGLSKIIYSGTLYGEQLLISPETYSASACERVPLTFSVTDGDGNLQESINGLLNVSVSSENTNACWMTSNDPEAKCSGSSDIEDVVVNNGFANLWLNGVGDNIRIKAAIKPKNSSRTIVGYAGPYFFDDIGLSINSGEPIDIVAGKNTNVPIKIVQSSVPGGECSTLDSVSQNIPFRTVTSYHQPSAGTKMTFVNGVESDNSSITSINFKGGEGNFKLRYRDAGFVSVNFEMALSQKEDKRIEEESRSIPDELNGVAHVYARPYVFAICGGPQSGLPTVTDVNGEKAFKKAGEKFDLQLKPLIWQTGDLNEPELSQGKPVTLTEEHCLRQATTSAFWFSDAPEATVKIEEDTRATSPTGALGEPVSGVVPLKNTSVSDNVYKFRDLSIDDVGSFVIRSTLGAKYPFGNADRYSKDVNPGELELGRFYPSHFGIASEFKRGVEAANDEDGNGFTYLEQPFVGEYTIHAMDINDKPVKNYHLYTGATDKAQFEDWVIDSGTQYPYQGTDLSTRWQGARLGDTQWVAGTGGASEVKVSGNMVMRKADTEDGPFEPLRFAAGVAVADRDNTQFELCTNEGDQGCTKSVKHPTDNRYGAQVAEGPFFFGRLRVGSFTETQDFSGEQNLPVIVEYWNGSRFATNSRDNASFVHLAGSLKEQLVSNSQNIDTQIQWQDGSTTEGTESVANGVYTFKVVPQQGNKTLPFREQFRFWQCLASGCEVDDTAVTGFVEQPWLQYGWESATELKKTSGLVTYGHYRGSDRLIYKGEKNITLTGE